MKSAIKLSEEPRHAILQEYFSVPSNFQKTSDVTLYCNDGYLPTHRLVLASVSSLFKEIVQENILCEKNISFMLPDFSVAEISSLLMYIYRGEDFPGDKRILDTFGIRQTAGTVKGEPEREPVNDIEAELASIEDPGPAESTETLEELEPELPNFQKTRRKNKSSVWKHMTRDPSQKNLFHCDYCGHVFKLHGGSTGTARAHLSNFHKDKLSQEEFRSLTSKSNRPHLRRSFLWKHFQYIDSGDDEGKAQCVYCGVVLTRSLGSTNGMKTHLMGFHQFLMDCETI